MHDLRSHGQSQNDLLVLCEQYGNEENQFWFRDSTGMAAIKIRSRARFLVSVNGAGDCFVSGLQDPGGLHGKRSRICDLYCGGEAHNTTGRS